MATLQRSGPALRVRFTRAEKLAGLVRDLDVPLTAVHDAEVVAEPFAVLSGLRAPGLRLPGRAIGVWRGGGTRTLVCLRRSQPAVRVELAGQRYDRLLIGQDDAAGVVAELTSAG